MLWGWKYILTYIWSWLANPCRPLLRPAPPLFSDFGKFSFLTLPPVNPLKLLFRTCAQWLYCSLNQPCCHKKIFCYFPTLLLLMHKKLPITTTAILPNSHYFTIFYKRKVSHHLCTYELPTTFDIYHISHFLPSILIQKAANLPSSLSDSLLYTWDHKGAQLLLTIPWKNRSESYHSSVRLLLLITRQELLSRDSLADTTTTLLHPKLNLLWDQNQATSAP